jgi:hypothetical protein
MVGSLGPVLHLARSSDKMHVQRSWLLWRAGGFVFIYGILTNDNLNLVERTQFFMAWRQKASWRYPFTEEVRKRPSSKEVGRGNVRAEAGPCVSGVKVSRMSTQHSSAFMPFRGRDGWKEKRAGSLLTPTPPTPTPSYRRQRVTQQRKQHFNLS